jgi:hypothetical protein
MEVLRVSELVEQPTGLDPDELVLAALYAHTSHPLKWTLAKDDRLRFLREITPDETAKLGLRTDTDSQLLDRIIEWAETTDPKPVSPDEKEV